MNQAKFRMLERLEQAPFKTAKKRELDTLYSLRWKGWARRMEKPYDNMEGWVITKSGQTALKRKRKLIAHPRPELGSRVQIMAHAHKTSTGYDTHWSRLSYSHPEEGIYIGYRQVYNGTWKETHPLDWDSADWYFSRTDQHEIWLVVKNDRTNPVRCFPDDVEVIDV